MQFVGVELELVEEGGEAGAVTTAWDSVSARAFFSPFPTIRTALKFTRRRISRTLSNTLKSVQKIGGRCGAQTRCFYSDNWVIRLRAGTDDRARGRYSSSTRRG